MRELVSHGVRRVRPRFKKRLERPEQQAMRELVSRSASRLKQQAMRELVSSGIKKAPNISARGFVFRSYLDFLPSSTSLSSSVNLAFAFGHDAVASSMIARIILSR